MARVKIKEEPIFKSWDDVDAALKEIAENEITIEEIEGEMNKQINGIKKSTALEVKPLQDRINSLGKDIKEFATANREDLDGKTKALNFGKTGFRLSTTLSIPTAKDKLANIISTLKRRKMDDCINVKETVNKEALKKYHEDTILEVGGTLRKKDTFWYETEREKIRSLR